MQCSGILQKILWKHECVESLQDMHTVSKKAKWQLSTDSWMNKMWSISESQNSIWRPRMKCSHRRSSQRGKSIQDSERTTGTALNSEAGCSVNWPEGQEDGPWNVRSWKGQNPPQQSNKRPERGSPHNSPDLCFFSFSPIAPTRNPSLLKSILSGLALQNQAQKG